MCFLPLPWNTHFQQRQPQVHTLFDPLPTPPPLLCPWLLWGWWSGESNVGTCGVAGDGGGGSGGAGDGEDGSSGGGSGGDGGGDGGKKFFVRNLHWIMNDIRDQGAGAGTHTKIFKV